MFTRPVLFALCLCLLPLMATAQNRAKVERQFQTWLQQDIWPEAKTAGVSRRTFKRAFAEVALNWDLPDLVPPGASPEVPKQQRQAEFGTPAKYFSPGAVQSASNTGRQMARIHATTLAKVEANTGVPGRIVLAIWGRESAYGRAKIPHNVFRVLGTKAFMSTRASYFRAELIAALQIAQGKHADPSTMKSSWAGALGQPQFMPRNYLQYAADGNGDGRADIWNSEADTLMSIGYFLAQHGWQSGRDWGFEVTLPTTVSCALEGPDQGRTIADWEKLGIKRVSGRAFPAKERAEQGFLMLPAGRHGPAFLVTRNFYVLKDYNKSDLYALFVGHVGDRIQYGVGDFAASWGRLDRLYRSDVAAMQRGLEALGHDVGGADGLVGFKTRRSLGRWQEASGTAPSCFPDRSMKTLASN
ncbi:lytic murein transglycosylase [Pseudophaeobacter sp.]|jgi:lytic murein transglycosylase|uniref:lytic murein transglycosylase n=1 Tax=Pseudophaeobacter sp. TaxID=1971739 RepID=UPI003A976439